MTAEREEKSEQTRKRLNLSAPLISVRKELIASAKADDDGEQHSADHMAVDTGSRRIPFVWESSPGKPKDSSGLMLMDSPTDLRLPPSPYRMTPSPGRRGLYFDELGAPHYLPPRDCGFMGLFFTKTVRHYVFGCSRFALSYNYRPSPNANIGQIGRIKSLNTTSEKINKLGEIKFVKNNIELFLAKFLCFKPKTQKGVADITIEKHRDRTLSGKKARKQVVGSDPSSIRMQENYLPGLEKFRVGGDADKRNRGSRMLGLSRR